METIFNFSHIWVVLLISWHFLISVFIGFILFSVCHLEMLVLLSCPTVICLLLSQGTEGGKQGRSSHTKQGEIKFTVSEYHTVTSDFNAHRGIKRDYLDSMVGASQPLATLCSEETGLVGSKKKKRIPNTECVTVSSALLPSNPSCSCSAACPLPHPPCTGAVLYKCVSLRWHVYSQGRGPGLCFQDDPDRTLHCNHTLCLRASSVISSHDTNTPSIGWWGNCAGSCTLIGS